ncbi:MAG: AgmX/PglI C-terminal domain-containing protein [Myxococcota bacterium]
MGRLLLVILALSCSSSATAQAPLREREVPNLFPAQPDPLGAIVRRTLHQRRHGYRRCFERELRRVGTLPHFAIEFTIRRNGTTSRHRLRGSEPVSRELTRCILYQLKSLRFPRQPRPVAIRFPLIGH